MLVCAECVEVTTHSVAGDDELKCFQWPCTVTYNHINNEQPSTGGKLWRNSN